MKTKMLSLLAVALLVISSCDDEPKAKTLADYITESQGTYNYTIKTYVLENGSLIYVGTEYDEKGTAVVQGNTAVSNMSVNSGGDVVFRGQKLALAQNGYTFDIAEFTDFDTDEDGNLQSFKITGYNGYLLAGVKYHGFYDALAKKMTGYLQHEDEDLDITLVFEYTATKI